MAQLRVRLGRVHDGDHTPPVKLGWRGRLGRPIPACAQLSAKEVGCQPEDQPDAERTYKHLAELAAPVSTCKLLINQ